MKVYVKTPARLHFGLIDLRGDLGRFFGGLGLGINYPNVILEVQQAQKFSVSGENTDLVKSLARRFCEAHPIPAAVDIQVKNAIPEHVGLGSGTQLALAVATALSKLFNIKASIQELALAMERGRRTSVGTTVFEQGGFVVDGGKKMKNGSVIPESFPPLIFRQPFPEDWLFVVAIPNVKKGLAKEEETDTFRRLSPMLVEDVGKICHLIMLKLLPSLLEHDIRNFGESLTQIQNVVGDYFAEVQGKRYSSSTAAESINFMKDCGAYGVGQSSWGPAVYGLVKGAEDANEIRLKLESFLHKKVGAKVFVAKANNRGAYIKVAK